MNKEEFIKEVNTSCIKPADFDEVYFDFCKYQKLAIETLNAVVAVCEKNSISYQLTFGSLLGAIRDGGQIPWDYDVDIFVPCEKREALVCALRKDLDKRWYFCSTETNKRCCRNIMRIAPVGYDSEELHVDVFFIAGTPNDPEERTKQAKRITKNQKIRYGKYADILYLSRGSAKRFIFLLLRKIICLCYNGEKLLNEYNMLCTKYALDNSEYIISTGLSADKRLYKTEWMVQSDSITTSDGTFSVPKGYIDLLKLVYGDYTKVPPLEVRLREIYNSHRKLAQYAKIG